MYCSSHKYPLKELFLNFKFGVKIRELQWPSLADTLLSEVKIQGGGRAANICRVCCYTRKGLIYNEYGLYIIRENTMKWKNKVTTARTETRKIRHTQNATPQN